jgi:hypothetical protein
MPYVASSGTYVPCRGGEHLTAEVCDFFTGIESIGYEESGFDDGVGGLETHRSGGQDDRQGDPCFAQISLVHNSFRPTAVSAVTILEGTTDGAG